MNKQSESDRDFETAYKNGTNRWQFVINIVATVSAAGVMWIGAQLIDLSNFKAATNANRFTTGDALKQFSKVNERLARIENTIREIPPEWFVRQVHKIETRVHDLERKMISSKKENGSRVSP